MSFFHLYLWIFFNYIHKIIHFHMEKNNILYKPFQVILFEYWDSDNNSNEAKYCEDDGEYRINCDINDKLCRERFYKNHFKSQTHTHNNRKKQQLNK